MPKYACVDPATGLIAGEVVCATPEEAAAIIADRTGFSGFRVWERPDEPGDLSMSAVWPTPMPGPPEP